MTRFLHERWPVVFEDNHLLIVYKPAGLLSQGDETGGASLLDLSKAWIKDRYRKPGQVFLGLVHRLDRPVAGVMVFARTSKAAARLSDQLRRRRMCKTYLAVVEGCPAVAEGRLVHHIERQERAVRIVSEPTTLSREARLIYRVSGSESGRSLVEVELETGRKHQIRLQLAHVGFPIVGDVRYGASSPLPSRPIALFAKQVVFEHPTRAEILSFAMPLPVGWPWPDSETEDSPLWNWEDFH
jgi:23S rRNA pseudouridine1911/1915/1917 synthase